MKKPIGGGSVISALAIDPIARTLGRLFAELPFTPNQITVAATVVGMFAGILFLYDAWTLGAISIFVSMVLDGLDGEIARIKRMKSKYGFFCDSLLDRFVDIFIIFGIAYSSIKFYGNMALVIGFFSAVFAGVLSSYSAKLIKIIGDIDTYWENEWPKFPDGRDIRLCLLMCGSLGNSFVHWSGLLSVFIIFLLSFVKVVARLVFYRHKFVD